MTTTIETRPPDHHTSLLPRSLGWFSIALGAAELLAPKTLARTIGAPYADEQLVRYLCGAREVAAGIAVLRRPQKALPLWLRVVGDALDVALLGIAMRGRRSDRARLGVALAAVLGVTAADVVGAIRNA